MRPIKELYEKYPLPPGISIPKYILGDPGPISKSDRKWAIKCMKESEWNPRR